MTNRVLESFSNTITVNLSSGGIVSIDVNTITSSQVTGLAPSATIDRTNASNITTGTFQANLINIPLSFTQNSTSITISVG